MAQLAAHTPDVLHVQWFGAPEADRWLFRPRSPVVFTAHDIIPRRTAARTGLWRSLFDRCDRVVVHSERGRDSLAAFGVDERALARHPPPRVPLGGRPARRRAHRARPGADPPVQGHRGLGRGGSPRRRREAPGRRRSASAARRASGNCGRPCRVAARLPAGQRDQARALRSNRRALPVPLRDRRLGRAPPGARRRCPRDRLRHRRDRRGRGEVRRGRGRRAGRRRWDGARARAAPR